MMLYLFWNFIKFTIYKDLILTWPVLERNIDAIDLRNVSPKRYV